MEEKDALYYSDFIYYIKRLANLITTPNLEKETRINKRLEEIECHEEGHLSYTLSDFTADVFDFTLSISKKVQVMLQGPSSLSKYPKLVEETIKKFFLKISEDYTETPGARYIADGLFSGEDFRDNVLEKKYLECLASNRKLIIDFDGGYGYSTGFLEESFGGMVRKGYHTTDLLNNIIFISTEEPSLINDITNYMLDEEERLVKERKK